MKKWFWLLFFALLFGALACWPIFRTGFFPMHDFTHVVRLQQLDKALKDGHFLARWSRDLGFGMGMPLFSFYAPLPYYLAELLHLIGFGLVGAIKSVFFLSFVVSFVGMYLLASEAWAYARNDEYRLAREKSMSWCGLSEVGLLSAVVFTFAPYHALDFYVRGALGELFGIMWIIFALYFVLRLLVSDVQLRLLGFALGLSIAGLMLSHNIMALLGLPLALGLAVWLFILRLFSSGFVNLIRPVVAVMFTVFWGLGLSAFFWLPAFFEKGYTVAPTLLTSGYSNFKYHFLYIRQFFQDRWGYGGSVLGLDDGMSFYLGRGVLVLVFFSSVWLFLVTIMRTRLWRSCGLRSLRVTTCFPLNRYLFEVKLKNLDKDFYKKYCFRFILFWYLLFFGSLYMCIFKSEWIWDRIFILHFVQFPWRFLSLALIGLSVIAGGALLIFRHRLKLIVLFLLALFLVMDNIGYFKPKEYVDSDRFYYTDESLIRTRMSLVLPDYIPVAGRRLLDESDDLDVEQLAMPVRLDQWSEARLKIIEDKTQSLSFVLDAAGEEHGVLGLREVTLGRFCYPGWKLLVDGRNYDYQCDQWGRVKFSLDQAAHRIDWLFGETTLRHWADLISVFSLGLGFLYLVAGFLPAGLVLKCTKNKIWVQKQ